MKNQTNTETPQASAALADILSARGVTATAFAELSRVGDVSSVSRDLGNRRSISPRRMRAYLSALNQLDARRLVSAYLRDLLGTFAEKILSPGDGARVAEASPVDPDTIRVPSHARAALQVLAECSQDLTVAQWLADSAAIIAPLAVPENRKKRDKRRKKDYG